jgi:SynChlorMet cassette radical SAM/SPASM protein ScmE
MTLDYDLGVSQVNGVQNRKQTERRRSLKRNAPGTKKTVIPMRVMRTPKQVDINITNDCNLRCKYCYHFGSEDDTGRDLPASEWLLFFEELNRCGVMEVVIAGGEPFIREDLKEIIQGIIRNRMRFSLLTNGTLVTGDMAAFVGATGRCNQVQVSIDGSIPVTHDSMRGRGSFKKAIEGIRTLQHHGINVEVRVTIHRKNVFDLKGIARLLFDEIGLSEFSTNSAGHMGLCRKNAESVQLTPAERSLAMETLLQLNEKYGGRISATAGPLAEARMFWGMEDARQCELREFNGGGCLTGCSGMMSKVAVRADGIMVPCTQLPMIELGRINLDRLEKVWWRHPELNRLRRRREIPLSNFTFCSGCEYIRYCTGSCPALAATLIGDPYHPAPDACLRKFLAEGGRLPDRTLLC